MGNIYVKALPNPLLYGNRLYVSKGYNVAFEFVWVFVTTLEESCVPLAGTRNFFLVYWLISYIIILLSSIKWHQSSLTFLAVWVDFLSDLSFDGRIRLLSGLSGCDLTHHHDQTVDKNNTKGHNPYAVY